MKNSFDLDLLARTQRAAIECAEDAAALRAENARLRAALELILPLVTDSRCINSVRWTTARDTARAALAASEVPPSVITLERPRLNASIAQ